MCSCSISFGWSPSSRTVNFIKPRAPVGSGAKGNWPAKEIPARGVGVAGQIGGGRQTGINARRTGRQLTAGQRARTIGSARAAASARRDQHGIAGQFIHVRRLIRGMGAVKQVVAEGIVVVAVKSIKVGGADGTAKNVVANAVGMGAVNGPEKDAVERSAVSCTRLFSIRQLSSA